MAKKAKDIFAGGVPVAPLNPENVTDAVTDWRHKAKGLDPDQIYPSTTSYMLPVSKVIPNEWNPNEQDDKTFQRLQDEIDEVGLTVPLTVVDMEDGTYRILSGEHRWRASNALGLAHVEAKVVPLSEWDEDQQKFKTLTMNWLEGEVSADKFRPLYREMADKYGEEAMPEMFGATDERAWKKLMAEMRESLKESLPTEDLKQEFEEKAKKAKTVDELTVLVETLMNKYGDNLDKSFMVFTYGKGRHIYVEMTPLMRRAMDRVTDFLMFSGGDINEFMLPVVEECLQRAEAEWESMEQAVEDATDDEVFA